MTNKNLFAAFLFALSALPLFAIQRNYFKHPTYDVDSEMPLPYTAMYNDYYDDVDAPECHFFEEWFSKSGAFPFFFDERAKLESSGVVPVFTYIGNFAGNPTGGRARGTGISNSFNLGVGLDIGKLSGKKALNGLSLGNTWAWRSGDSITPKYLGNTFSVQQNYGSQTINFQSLFLMYEKPIFDDEYILRLKLGRFAAGDNFMTKPIYWLYMSNSVDGNPVGMFYQTKLSAYPSGVWGAYLNLEQKDGAYIKAGVYQINDPSQDANSRHGLDWSFEKSIGVNANFEIGWDINHDDSGKSPANVSVGIISDWYNAPHNDDPNKYSYFNCSLYFQADYMVWNMGMPKREKASYITRDTSNAYRDLRGIIAWAAVQYDPNENLAYMPFFACGGLLFNAPFKSRADDVLCFAVAYGKYSDKLLAPEKGSYEMVLELNYKIQLNKFLFLQPDIQYIINTKGGAYPDALVLGAQFGVAF